MRTHLCLLLGLATAGVAVGGPRGRDVCATVAAEARKAAAHAGPLAFQVPIDYESADLFTEVAPDRLLVGAVSVNSSPGAPAYGPLILVDMATGRELWRAPRGSDWRRDYQVLATTPSLVVLAVKGAHLEFLALDPGTGRTRWKLKATYPLQMAATGPRLLLLEPEASRLRCLDLASGGEVWSLPIPPEVLGASDPSLEVLGDTAVVVGRRALGVDTRRGGIRWRLSHEALGASGALLALGDALLHWTADSMLALDPETGAVLWHRAGPGQALAVQAAAGTGLRVRAESGGQVLEAWDPRTGAASWTRPLPGALVGPLLVSHGRVLASLEDRVLGLGVADGAVAFDTPLPAGFEAASPRRARYLGLPDLLLVVDDHLVVRRETIGVAAVALPGGALLWDQRAYSGRVEYNSDEATSLRRTAQGFLGGSAPRAPTPGGTAWTQPGPNAFLIAAERQHATVMAETSRTLADSSSTRLERRGAIESRQMSASLSESRQRVAIAGEQMQAGVAFATSLLAAGAAFRQAQQRAVQAGLQQRMDLLARAILRWPSRALQGRWYLDPFGAKGAGFGVSVVDLGTGRRADVLTSPIVAPLLDYSVDLVPFAVDARRRRLFTLGVSFDPRNHHPVRKWGWRFPGRALLALDLTRVEFGPENTLKATVSKANEGDLAAAIGSEPAALPVAAAGGLLDQVRRLLDLGIDPDTAGAAAMTALHMAAVQGHAEVVALLLERGANPDRKDVSGKSPRDYARSLAAGLGPEDAPRRARVAELLGVAPAR